MDVLSRNTRLSAPCLVRQRLLVILSRCEALPSRRKRPDHRMAAMRALGNGYFSTPRVFASSSRRRGHLLVPGRIAGGTQASVRKRLVGRSATRRNAVAPGLRLVPASAIRRPSPSRDKAWQSSESRSRVGWRSEKVEALRLDLHPERASISSPGQVSRPTRSQEDTIRHKSLTLCRKCVI